MKKTHMSTSCLILAFSFLLVCTGVTQAKEEEPIKIGVLAPLTGFAAAFGLPVLYTTQMWADEVNAAGGLEVAGVKHKIEIFKEDSKFESSAAASGAEKLVHVNKVRFIHGPCSPFEFMAIAPLTTPAKVITFSYNWTAELSSSKYPYNFNAMPSPRELAKPMFAYLKKKYPDKKRIVVMGFRDQTSEETMAVIVKAAESLGFEVADKVWYEISTKDYSAVITKALAQKPDILSFGWANPGMAGAQIKTARGLGFKGVTMQHTQGDLETIASIAGDAAEGHYYLGGGADETVATDRMKKFRTEYTKRYGRWNDGAAQELYVPLMIGKGIQKAGTFADSDKVVRALETMSFTSDYVKGGPRVYFTKEADRNSVLVSPSTFVQIQNGKEKSVTILEEMQ